MVRKNFNEIISSIIKNNETIYQLNAKLDNVEITDNEITIKYIDFTAMAIKQQIFEERDSKKKVTIEKKSNNQTIVFKKCNFNGCLELCDFLGFNFKFYECEFRNLVFYNIEKTPLSNLKNTEQKYFNYGIEFIRCDIENLNIRNCEFNGIFYVNDKEPRVKTKKANSNKFTPMEYERKAIGYLSIWNVIFNKKFKFNNIEIHSADIQDVIFNDRADFYKNVFGYKLWDNPITFMNLEFKELTIFDKCEFLHYLDMDNVSFARLAQFKKAIFHDGLNLDKTNIENEINFYDVQELDSKLSKEKTSRETYRIIKYNFEKIGNKIEANKYHAFELEQKRKDLEENISSDWREKWVFRFHDWSSEHSTNWFRALWLIFLVGFLTIFLVHFDIVKDLFFHPNHFKIEYISKIWNEFWQYINITNLEKLKDKPFIFFLNKVSLGYLYYQFLTAVRKDTRK
ncbi:MAG: hypothetical protein WC665_02995 [Sulfurimonas sp.]|jgi:uncharacterized protein YjbI with pentapeptide repeats